MSEEEKPVTGTEVEATKPTLTETPKAPEEPAKNPRR